MGSRRLPTTTTYDVLSLFLCMYDHGPGFHMSYVNDQWNVDFIGFFSPYRQEMSKHNSLVYIKILYYMQPFETNAIHFVAYINDMLYVIYIWHMEVCTMNYSLTNIDGIQCGIFSGGHIKYSFPPHYSITFSIDVNSIICLVRLQSFPFSLPYNNSWKFVHFWENKFFASLLLVFKIWFVYICKKRASFHIGDENM